MTICAIHQPNFFPWLGYFDKILKADIFVFLDNVAYPKSGSGSGSWVNRVKIPIQEKAYWIRSPIKRQSGIQLINKVQVDNTQPWKKKLWRTLELNYSKAPNYKIIMDFLHPIIFKELEFLSDYNINAIKEIANRLNLTTQFIRQSEIFTTKQSTELLIEITQKVNADTYLCGGGAAEYQVDTLFLQRNIELKYQNFTPIPYTTKTLFIPGMSVIDFLMWQC